MSEKSNNKKRSAAGAPELSVGEQRELRTPVHGRHGRACPRSRMLSGEGGVSHPASQIWHPEGFP
ncbi:MAG TPA: hypothetical protein VFK21_01175 [Gammaproteobacteria bacterium]|nr:hypothetical protein [Gammaproteobacteria bacterium]